MCQEVGTRNYFNAAILPRKFSDLDRKSKTHISSKTNPVIVYLSNTFIGYVILFKHNLQTCFK